MKEPTATILDVLERLGVRAGNPERRQGVADQLTREGMTLEDAEVFYQWFHRMTGSTDEPMVAARAGAACKDGAWRLIVEDARKTMRDSVSGRRRRRSNQPERNQMRPEQQTMGRALDQNTLILSRLLSDDASIARVSEESGKSPEALQAILEDPRYADYLPHERKRRDERIARMGKPAPWPPKGGAKIKTVDEALAEPKPDRPPLDSLPKFSDVFPDFLSLSPEQQVLLRPPKGGSYYDKR